jgi:hypothetical protein
MSGINNIKKLLSYSYSDSDIRHYFPNAKIMEYKDLWNYNNLFDILPEDKSYVFILIETKKRCGHWSVLCRLGNGATDGKLFYFDSYGLGVDEELKYVSPFWRKELRENEKKLTKLIKDCPYQLFYNAKQLQSRKNFDNTCARWCILFVLKFLDGMDIQKFLKYVEIGTETMGIEGAGKLKYSIFVINKINYMPNV